MIFFASKKFSTISICFFKYFQSNTYDEEAKHPRKLDKNRKEFVDLLNRQIQNASSQRMFNSSGLTEVLSRLKRTAETFCYGGLAKTKRSVTKEDYDKKWKFYIAPYMPPDFDQVNRRLS